MSMILFPIILMPLMSFGMIKFISSRSEKLKEEKSVVIWISENSPDKLLDMISSESGIDLLSSSLDSTIALEMLREKDVDAVVFVPVDFYSRLEIYISGESDSKPGDIKLFSDNTRQKSQFAASKIINIIDGFRSDLVAYNLSQRGLPEDIVKPFFIIPKNIASPEDMGRFFAGSFLPYIVILMALTGAMYPAIDLTAGEKERGTLETLLVSGVARMDIVLGKFLTVFTSSLVTATLAVVSLAATGAGLIGMSPEQTSKLNFSIEPVGIMLMILAMIPLGAIFSSLLMTISLFAKSYREAQSYISPLMIVVIMPAMVSFIPDMVLSKKMALIPIINVSMLMKEALVGSFDLTSLLVTMAVNLILAAGGLFLILKMFQRESVLFRI